MTNFVDFGDIHKVFLGNTEITFLQRGSNLLWKSFELEPDNVAFPNHLMNAWGRAYDPNGDFNFTDIDGDNAVVVGDTLMRINSAYAYNVGSGNTSMASTSTRLIANTSVGSGPQLVDHVGRRCWKYNGANNYGLMLNL